MNHLANGHVVQRRGNCSQPTTVRRRSSQKVSLGENDSHASQIAHLERSSPRQPSQQPARDPKSFTQALFDALPLKLLEWMPRKEQLSTTDEYRLGQRQQSYGADQELREGSRYCRLTVQDNYHEPAPARGKGKDVDGTAATPSLNGCALVNGHVKEPLDASMRRKSSIERTLRNGELETGAHSLLVSEGVDYQVQADEFPQRLYDTSESPHMVDGRGQVLRQSSGFGPCINRTLAAPTLTSLSTDILRELKGLHSETGKEVTKSILSDFFRQSLYYCLKDPCRLLASFETAESSATDSKATSHSGQGQWSSRVNTQSVSISLSSMSVLCSWPEVIRNLSIATHSLYIPASSRRPLQPVSPFNDRQAAGVCIIGLYALSELVQNAINIPNIALPVVSDLEGIFHLYRKLLLETCDVFDDFEPLSLLETIVSVIANRWTHWEISKAHRNTGLDSHGSKLPNVIQLVLDYMADDANEKLNTITQLKTSTEHGGQFPVTPHSLRSGFLSRLTLYLLRKLFLRDWDGKTSVRKSNTVGIILQILAAMYEKHSSVGLEPEDFWIQALVQRFDPFDMPMEWLAFRPDNKTVHILSYSFLFPPETVVTYFRAINYSRMMKTTEGAMLTKRSYSEFIMSYGIPVPRRDRLEQRLEIASQPRFVITVRRDDVLTEAINQIWRRQKRELLRPLKVRMGTDEGEEGVDSGGVQQELFRVLFGQALDPSYGMFTVDGETRMTWFQPESPEPLYKFEALGILMSLAVYNSITLPITFPLAFYRKLLGLKVKRLEHIRDGWPVLAENLQRLLDWKDGDVSEVFMRTSEFSYEAFGKITSIDMERNKRDMPWPPQPTRKGTKTASFDVPAAQSSGKSAIPVATSTSWGEATTTEDYDHREPLEASLVTNANREQYVKDYVFWLADKSIRPQYEAFARGFYTCLDRTALSIFTAEALQSFIEGIQEIDIDRLQASTVYHEYTEDDQVVKWFWETVKSWDHRKKKLLLEFVTASDRVPVNGVGVIGFGIQNNGARDERLPSSMTCFGMLLLPEYSSKEVLEKMLGIAIEQAKGFGTA